MDYIAVIDYEHLDNAMFLTAFARSLSQQKSRGIILHGDSTYTERLIQTGLIREEAEVRSVKDLNHRLIALLADHGVSAIGLNGYQRSLVKQTADSVQIDTAQFRNLPAQPHLLLSNLIQTGSGHQPQTIDLPLYVTLLSSALDIREVFIFSMDESEEFIQKDRPEKLYKRQLNDEFIESHIPAEFQDIPIPVRLTSARLFSDYPSTRGTTWLIPDS